MTTLGIDIGGTAVKAALSSPREPRDFITSISTEYARPDRTTLNTAIRQAISGLPPEILRDIAAVGLCVPGRRARDGASIELAVNVPGLVGYRFDDLIADAIGRSAPLVLLGDAEAATLDLAHEHPGPSRVLGIAIGTGVGIAVVEHGRAVGIGSGGAGHFGQIDVGPIGDGATPGSIIGPDGGRDSLEAYLGLPALRARFGAELPTRIATLGEHDPALIALARAIRIGLALYTPDRVLLLGGLGLAFKPLGGRIEAMIRDGLTGVAPRGWTLGFGSSRFHAARGAARAATP